MFLILLLSACPSEYEVADPDWVYNPPELMAEERTDYLVQIPEPALDVLFVIDNSESMAEEQLALTTSFEHLMAWFVDSGTDYHVGVISTDMEDPAQAGMLQADGDSLFIDVGYDRDSAVESFSARASLGTDGSHLERALDAIYTAIALMADQQNAGFYRSEASLALIVISDEDDYSTDITVTGFIDWFESLKEEPGQRSFSAIVSMDTDCPTEPGLDYLDIADQVQGSTASICTIVWEEAMDTLGLALSGLQREFFLSELPVEETIDIRVQEPGEETIVFADGEGYVYSQVRNSIAFSELVPAASSEVYITYDLLSSAQATVDPD